MMIRRNLTLRKVRGHGKKFEKTGRVERQHSRIAQRQGSEREWEIL
jgi:hypothetical protein